ncbi:DUF7281 domain-containing protein [Pontibacter sp. JAM-7]|uniref:DUF7281 domain-containing protein n=1 Tax=Pontibacter sp. JAM-7 TaxID=3366581 RepID=UPI003AF939DC
MRREFKVIQAYFLNGGPTAKLNSTWKRIHDEHGVGRISGNSTITFSQKDRDYLQGWMDEELGLNPHSKSELPKSRVEAALRGKSEKVSGKNVFSDLIKVARADGTAINTHSGLAILPPRCFMNTPASNLILENETVVIVENGELIRDWSGLRLPQELSNSLLIYRGHEEDAREVKQLLEINPPAKSVGFYDFDPAGMSIGLSNNHDAILVPADISIWTKENPEFNKFNQPDIFWKQARQLKTAEMKACGEACELLISMKDQNIAVMQEHIIANKIPLRIIEMKQ